MVSSAVIFNQKCLLPYVHIIDGLHDFNNYKLLSAYESVLRSEKWNGMCSPNTVISSWVRFILPELYVVMYIMFISSLVSLDLLGRAITFQTSIVAVMRCLVYRYTIYLWIEWLLLLIL